MPAWWTSADRMSPMFRFYRLPRNERSAYWTAFRWLIAFRLWFYCASFHRITDFVAARRVRAHAHTRLPLERLYAILHNAGVRVPSTCLTRSLAGAVVLARFGYPSQVCIGVSGTPDFRAHAWLECEGRCLGENADSVAHWKELTRVSVGM
jgi:hypothetical protein